MSKDIIIGLLIGFVLSLIGFYIKDKISMIMRRKKLEKNLLKEFKFNEFFLTELLNNLKDMLSKIEILTTVKNNLKSLLSLKETLTVKGEIITTAHENYRRFFLEQYFKQGIHFEKLDEKDICKLDRILLFMSYKHKIYIADKLEQWRKGKLEKGDKEIKKIIEEEIEMISEFIEDIKKIKQKLVS